MAWFRGHPAPAKHDETQPQSAGVLAWSACYRADVPDLAALLFQADRLLALLVTGKAGAEAARELAGVLEALEAVARRSGMP